MEDTTGQNGTPNDPARENEDTVVVSGTVEHSNQQDVEKSLYDAEEFLTNFAGLREENEQLKQSNQELQLQLEKARQDIQQLVLEKQALETELVQEREQNREEVWKVRSEFQKLQEERLQWKEKYLNICMKTNAEDSSSSRSKKRKQSATNPALDSDSNDFYNNLSSTLGLDQDDQQPVPPVITNQLWDPETKRFECKECKATFRMFSDLQSHIDKNKCVKYTFQCPQCSVVFSNATSFTKHLKYHMTKNVICEYCGDKFMHDKGLQRHIKMYHTEFNTQFQCQYCSKIFGRKTLLENHIRRHFDYRPFKCNLCDKSFKTRQYLTGHINGVHKNDKQFICDKCDARFSWRTTWKRHMQNHIFKANKKKNKKAASLAAATGLPAQNVVNATVTSVADLQQQLTQTVAQLSHPELTQNIVHIQPQQLSTISQLTHDVTQLPQ